MKLLEKLRARPEWKDEDAAVRAAAVRSMAAQGDAQELLVQIARQDDDPSVRREAVRWIENVDERALRSSIRPRRDCSDGRF